jgi:hypothetical protein
LLPPPPAFEVLPPPPADVVSVPLEVLPVVIAVGSGFESPPHAMTGSEVRAMTQNDRLRAL